MALTDAPPASPADGSGYATEQVVYDLSEWEPLTLALLDDALTTEGIPHVWEGDDLVIPAVYEDAAEVVLDRIEHPDQLAASDMTRDELRAAELLSDLFLLADRLTRDPAGSGPVGEMVRAGEEAARLHAPYGVAPPLWEEATMLAAVIRSDLLGQAEHGRIRTNARRLRELLRPLV